MKIYVSKKSFKKKGSSGSYGTYIPLTKEKGVKIVKRKALAIKEGRLLKKANELPFTPRFFCVVEVFIKGSKRKYFGILQEHIEGKRVEDCNKTDRIFRDFQKQLLKIGIDYTDTNPKNILITKEDTPILIDFTPGWTNHAHKTN